MERHILNRGFSLIESALVLAVMGLLTTALVLSSQASRCNALHQQMVSEMTAIADEAQVFHQRFGAWPNDVDEMNNRLAIHLKGKNPYGAKYLFDTHLPSFVVTTHLQQKPPIQESGSLFCEEGKEHIWVCSMRVLKPRTISTRFDYVEQ